MNEATSADARVIRVSRAAVEWQENLPPGSASPRRGRVRCVDSRPAPTVDGRAPLAGTSLTAFVEVLEPGCEGGLHNHADTEEMYVLLAGEDVCLRVEVGDRVDETPLAPDDVVLIAPGTMRAISNRGRTQARFLTVFGTGAPMPAIHHPTHPQYRAPVANDETGKGGASPKQGEPS